MNKTKFTRIIRTGLFSKIADEIVRSVHAQLSDGMWENSRAAEKYWLNYDSSIDDNGEVIFKLNAESYTYSDGHYYDNIFVDMTDDEFKKWFAKKLKAVISADIRDNCRSKTKAWRRDNNEFKSNYIGYDLKISVAEIYCVYDAMLGRTSRCDCADAVVGKRRTKAETAKAKVNRAEIKIVVERFEKKAADLKAKRDAAIEAAKTAYDNNRMKLWNEINAALTAKFGKEWMQIAND